MSSKTVVYVPVISEHVKAANVPLSPAVKAGGFVFVSGLPGIDLITGTVPVADISVQTRLSLDALKGTLEAAGSSLEKVVKCTIFITNAAYYDIVNRIYGEYFHCEPPARVFCVVGSWPLKFDIEIDCIAVE